MHMRRRAVALHTLACAALIALNLTDRQMDRDFDSPCTGTWLLCFDLTEPIRARKMGAQAKTSTVAAGTRLYGLVICMLHTRIGSLSAVLRRSTESWLYLYNMTCGATHVLSAVA